MRNAVINDEELETTFVVAKGSINNRPLTYYSSHPADDIPFISNHFLYGQLGGTFAPDSIDETQFNLKMLKSAGVDKTLLATLVKSMDFKFEFSQKNGTIRKMISKLEMWC